MDVTSSIISLVEAAVAAEPALVAEFKTLFGSETPPTAAQFQALRDKVEAENFGA